MEKGKKKTGRDGTEVREKHATLEINF